MTTAWSRPEALKVVGLLRAHGVLAWTDEGPAVDPWPGAGAETVEEVHVIVAEADIELAADLLSEHSDTLLGNSEL